MNISKRYAWQSTGNCRENNLRLHQSLRGLVIGKSGCGKTAVIFNLLLQPGWLDYNHLYIFGKSLHQQEYKILRKGFEGGLSKRKISNVFNSQEMLQSPLIAIEKYSGVRNGEIRADFYDDCQNIPDPSALDPTQKNLLLLDDCFLGKQNKAEAYYTRGRHNNCDTIYIAQNYFRLPCHTIRENPNFIILFPQDTKNLTHIHADHCADDIPLLEFKQFCHRVWSEEHNFVTIDPTSTPMNGKYRQTFNRFYFPTGCMSRHRVVKEYVTAMKTVLQRNMANRELKLAIGDELYTFSIHLSMQPNKRLKKLGKNSNQ